MHATMFAMDRATDVFELVLTDAHGSDRAQTAVA